MDRKPLSGRPLRFRRRLLAPLDGARRADIGVDFQRPLLQEHRPRIAEIPVPAGMPRPSRILRGQLQPYLAAAGEETERSTNAQTGPLPQNSLNSDLSANRPAFEYLERADRHRPAFAPAIG